MGGKKKLGAHQWEAGALLQYARYDKRKNTWSSSNVASESAAIAGLALKTPPGQNDVYTIDERQSALYLQDQWQLGERHGLTLGLRQEGVQRHAVDRAGAARDSSNTSPNPSLLYRWNITPAWTMRTSLARTLRHPKFDDTNPLVVTASGTLSSPDKAGNADLLPEQASALEWGLERNFAQNHGLVGVNLYYRNVADYIEKITRLEGSRYVQRPYNVGTARLWGAEFELRAPLVESRIHTLTLQATHAQMRGIISKTSNGTEQNVKDMPAHVTNLSLNWAHRPSNWSAGINLNHVPGYTSDTDNDSGEREIKKAGEMNTLDLYVSKAFSPQAEFRLVAKNVLSVAKREDKVVYTSAGAVKSGENKTESSQPSIYLTWECRF
ncbi:MAG: TonB-dependent receptor domain-containing protein [Rhodoferax sp.]